MKMTLTGFFLFVLGLHIAETDRIHFYVPTPLTWTEAISYCEQYYTTLSTVTSEEEHQKLVAAAGGTSFQGFIGLYRPSSNPNNWAWYGGESFSFTKVSNANNKDVCVYAANSYWYTSSCEMSRPFFCHREYDVQLVMLNMTWEGALIHCRERLALDLASATNEYELEILQNKSKLSRTEGVWTGLRFLAGEWHWMSKSVKYIPYQGSLPSCPEEPYRCGALNKRTEQWEMRDCQEMLNFVCY